MSTVSPQITDAVTQTNVKVVAESPAMAMSTIYQSMGQATAILFQNSVSAQQQQKSPTAHREAETAKAHRG